MRFAHEHGAQEFVQLRQGHSWKWQMKTIDFNGIVSFELLKLTLGFLSLH